MDDYAEIRERLIRVEAKQDTSLSLLMLYEKSLARVDARQWAMLAGLVAAFGTALLGLLVK